MRALTSNPPLEPPLVWIDFDGYAHAVFSRRNPFWLTDPTLRIGAVSQAQSVLRSEVIILDVAAPFAASASAGGEWFSDPAAASYLRTYAGALSRRLGDHASLVVGLPAPRDLWRGIASNAGKSPTFDDLDELAAAASPWLRELATGPWRGLVVRHADGQPPDDDAQEAMAPWIAAARHYNWTVAIEFRGVEADWQPLAEAVDAAKADLLLLPDLDRDPRAAADARPLCGCGLGSPFWSGDGARLPSAQLWYGIVPATASPERVVARAASLRGVTS